MVGSRLCLHLNSYSEEERSIIEFGDLRLLEHIAGSLDNVCLLEACGSSDEHIEGVSS